MTCPFDCAYLRDARLHEKPALLDTEHLPNRDIRVKESLLEENAQLLAFLMRALAAAALQTPGVVDFDVRDALEALIRTYRTLESGIYYETRPENSLARELFAALQTAVAEFRNREQQERGLSKTRDTDILAILVFLQRLELDRNNGRRRGRAFINMLDDLSREDAIAGLDRSRLVVP